jgi:NADH-quinone oxidoreductase subunit L
MKEWILFLILFLAPIISSVPIALAYRRKEWVDKLPPLSVFGIFISVIVSIYILLSFPDKSFSYPWIPELGINFVIITDYLSKYMGVITALIAFFIGVYGLEYMKGDYRLPWYWFLYNLFTASMLLVVYSDNLFLLFVGWEGLGLASWGLIGHWYRDDDELSYVGTMDRKVGPLNFFWPPSAGGWRAISTIRFGDVPMFLAIAAIWLLTGNLNISQIEWGALFVKIGFAGTLIIFLFFLTGLLTKSAQVPFTEWLMTAMTGPTTVSALLHSATMVAAGAYVFMRMTWYIKPWTLNNVPGLETAYGVALFIGLVSGLYGALAASGMLEKKVLLAATTMSSLGLMFGATASSYWIHTMVDGMNLAVLAGFWYLATHAFAKASLFLVSGHLIHAIHSRFAVGDIELGKKMKITFATTIIATTFLVGIPPLTAYWVKSAMDHLMEHLYSIGYSIAPLILLLATSITYSAALAKFTSTNFIKGEKPHEVHLEGGWFMRAGYIMMVSMLFVIFYLIFTRPELKDFVSVGFVPMSIAVGIATLAAYVVAIYKPRIASLLKLGTFFSDRMYFPYLNDYICPKIGFFISRICDYVSRGLDGFSNIWVMPGLFKRISGSIRLIQTGQLTKYVQIVLGVVMAFLIIATIVMGVMLV